MATFTEGPQHHAKGYGPQRRNVVRVLLALAAALTTFAVAWLTQDWFNTILSKLPLTLGGPARVTDLLVT